MQEFETDTCASLTSLDFSHYRDFNLDRLNLTKFKNLDQLSLRGIGTGKLLNEISCLSKLSRLDLSVPDIPTQYIKKLSENEMLESLRINDIPDNESLAALFQSRSLKYIDIGESEAISEVVIEDNDYIKSFKAYSSGNIKKVYIRNCKSLSSLDMEMCYPRELFIENVDSLAFMRVCLNRADNIEVLFKQLNRCENMYSLFMEMPVVGEDLDLSNLTQLSQLNFGTAKSRYVKKLILSKEISNKSFEFYGYNGPIEYR